MKFSIKQPQGGHWYRIYGVNEFGQTLSWSNVAEEPLLEVYVDRIARTDPKVTLVSYGVWPREEDRPEWRGDTSKLLRNMESLWAIGQRIDNIRGAEAINRARARLKLGPSTDELAQELAEFGKPRKPVPKLPFEVFMPAEKKRSADDCMNAVRILCGGNAK